MAVLAVGVLATTARARDGEIPRRSRIAVGVRASTLGTGVEIMGGLSRRFNLRATAGFAGLRYRRTGGSMDYDTRFHARPAGAILDWHPTGGAFRFSGGLVLHNMHAEGSASPNGPVRIGGVRFSAEQIGTLTGRVEPSRAYAGYAGLGFGHAPRHRKRLRVIADLGVMFLGDADFSLSADGMAARYPAFQAALEAERRQVEEDYRDYIRYYPVLTLGLAFRF